METHYSAYGLALRSSFGLIGMTPVDRTELPVLKLELMASEACADRWSGADGPPVWSGRLGDGSDLTLEQGLEGDFLFSHGSHARHHLDSGLGSLVCIPLDGGLEWQRALLTKVLACVSVMRGYEALHAGAVDSPEGAVAILAPAGMGKTTLVLELMQRGWPLLSDDVLALAATPEAVLAYPGTPHMNVAAGDFDGGSPDQVGTELGTIAGERWLAAWKTSREPRPVRAICLLERGMGLPLAVQILPSGPLTFAPYMLGLLEDGERERHRFELYSDLAGAAVTLRLTCDVTDRAGDLAELIERTLEVSSNAPMALEGAR